MDSSQTVVDLEGEPGKLDATDIAPKKADLEMEATGTGDEEIGVLGSDTSGLGIREEETFEAVERRTRV